MKPGSLSRRRDLWKSLGNRSLARLLLAIFFTFGSVGLLNELISLGRGDRVLPPATISYLLAGVVSVAYFLAFARNPRLVFLVIPGHILLTMFVDRMVGPATIRPDAGGAGAADDFLRQRMLWDALGIMGSIILGYIFFLSFIRTEGTKHLRLETEMGLAGEIHEALVPELAGRTARFEWLGGSLPSGKMGGDLIDAVEDAGHRTFYVIDVVGHGVPAGVLMAMTKSAARMRLRTEGSLTAFLGDLNRSFLEVNRPELFATCAAIRFDGSDEVEFSLAGHLPVLHFHGEGREVEELAAGGLPLGILPGEVYAAARVRFAPGDVFALVTDGLTEVFDRNGEEFGLGRIKRLLGDCADRPLEEIRASLVESVRRHGAQLDDQTLLLVRAV